MDFEHSENIRLADIFRGFCYAKKLVRTPAATLFILSNIKVINLETFYKYMRLRKIGLGNPHKGINGYGGLFFPEAKPLYLPNAL